MKKKLFTLVLVVIILAAIIYPYGEKKGWWDDWSSKPTTTRQRGFYPRETYLLGQDTASYDRDSLLVIFRVLSSDSTYVISTAGVLNMGVAQITPSDITHGSFPIMARWEALDGRIVAPRTNLNWSAILMNMQDGGNVWPQEMNSVRLSFTADQTNFLAAADTVPLKKATLWRVMKKTKK